MAEAHQQNSDPACGAVFRWDAAWQDGRDGRHRSIPRFHCDECLLKVFGESNLAIGSRFCPQNAEGVAKPQQYAPWHDIGVDELFETALEHRKHADEVAAVDRGHILRGEWRKRAGVIPVEEMASVTLHLRQRVECQLGAGHQPAD